MTQVTSFGTPTMVRATSGSVTGSVSGLPLHAGDLLVALVTAGGSTASAAAISTPSGWTQQVVTSNVATTANAWVAVYTKTAAGSDSAPAFTATLSGTVAMTVTLFELAAAANLNPVDTYGTYASGGTAGTLTLTATTGRNVSVAGEFAIACFCMERAAATNTWTPGSGWTNAANDGTTNTVLHTAVDYRANPSSGSTLAETGSWTTETTAYGAGIILTVTPQLGAIELYANDASTTISSGGTDAPASGTPEFLTAASWSSFPAASNTTTPPAKFHGADPASGMSGELIEVLNTTTGLAIRGAQGTTPVAHSGGFTLRQVIPAGNQQTRVYNVRDPQFGAKGDGSTDDTAAIQAAVVACGTAGGGVVSFPPGTYACTGAINVDYDNVALAGAGYGFSTTLTYISGTSRTAAIVVGATGLRQTCSITGLAINAGNGLALQSGSGHGIVFRVNNGEIRDVIVAWADQDAFHMSMDGLTTGSPVAYDLSMYNCYAQYPGNDGYYLSADFSDSELTVCRGIGGTQITGTPFGNYGIECYAGDVKFLQCHMYFFLAGGAYVSDAYPVSFIGGAYETNGTAAGSSAPGISLNGVLSGKIIGADLYANDGTGGTAADILITGCQVIYVSNCLMQSNATQNIYISESTYIYVLDNNLDSAGQGNNNYNVYLAAGSPVCSYISVKNNNLLANNDSSVYLNAATNCEVSGNVTNLGVTESGAANFNRYFANVYNQTYSNPWGIVGAKSVAWGNTGTAEASSTITMQQSSYAATSPVTVTAAAIASLGSITVPADEPVAGSVYKFTAHGTLGTASSAPTYILDMRWGGTGGTLIASVQSTATANAPALGTSLSARPVLIEGQVEFITSTTCVGWLRLQWLNSATATTAANWITAFASVTSAVTVTTNSNEAFTVDWTWSATGTGTTITIASSVFEHVA